MGKSKIKRNRAESQWVWDFAIKNMADIQRQLFGQPLTELTPRRNVGLFFSVRVMRRNIALDNLFKLGFYSEALLLVRSAYEDWITLAYILAAEGPARVEEFDNDVDKMDARVYKGFLELAGSKATEEVFGAPTPEIQGLLGKLNRELLPWGGRSWRDMTEEIGLAKVHNFVYPYLSWMGHGAVKNVNELLDFDDHGVVKAKVPKRESSSEDYLAWWTCWFHLRVLTMVGRELGHDLEKHSDVLLEEVSGDFFESCVMQREVLPHSS